MTTRRTQFRRREELVQLEVCSTVPFRLVFQFAEYFPERRIYDVFGKIVILNHPDYVQSFDKNRLVFADDLRREFLKRIPSGIADFGVQFGYFKSGLLTIGPALDLAREPSLKSLQSLFTLDEWARVFDLLAIAGRGQRLNTDVYTDFGLGLFERLDVGFNQDADKIASARIPTNGQVEDFCVIWKGTTPGNIERFGLLCQYDLAVSKGEGIGGVASRLAMTARFKFRILRSLLEEVRESCIEIPQRLLKNNRTDLGKKEFLGLLFPFCEFQRSVVIAKGFLLLSPSLAAIVQSLIVNIASAAKGFGKLRKLLISRVESVFKRPLDYHRDILRHIRRLCNHC
jgi:hypothetical protein